MYVRMNFGPNAGKDIDLAPEAAIGLISDGRASRAFQDEPAVKVASAQTAQPQPAVKKAAKRRG